MKYTLVKREAYLVSEFGRFTLHERRFTRLKTPLVAFVNSLQSDLMGIFPARYSDAPCKRSLHPVLGKHRVLLLKKRGAPLPRPLPRRLCCGLTKQMR